MATLAPPPGATGFDGAAWVRWLNNAAELLGAEGSLVLLARIPAQPTATPYLKSDGTVSWAWIKWLVSTRFNVNILLTESADCLGTTTTGRFRHLPPPPEPTPFLDSQGRVSWVWQKWFQSFQSAVNITLTEGAACLASNPKIRTVHKMVSRPQQSSNSTEKTYNSTLIPFNPAWFDGNPVFSMELYGENANASNAYTVTVEDADTLDVIATLDIPANQTTRYWQATTFTPPSGLRKYRMRLAQTGNANDLKVYELNIAIVQDKTITATRLQFPLLFGQAINQNDLVMGDSHFTFGDSGYTEESNPTLFLKEAGAWADIVTWHLESVCGNTGTLGANHAYVSLNRKSDGAQVVENDHTIETSATELIVTDFSDGATNFDDGEEFVIYGRATTTGSANNTLLLKVGLAVTLENFSKANLYFVCQDNGRQYINAAHYGALASAHYELTGRETSGGTQSRKLDKSTGPLASDSESDVSGALIDPTSSTKARYRVAIEAPSGEAYYEAATVTGTGGISIQGDYLILKVDNT